MGLKISKSFLLCLSTNAKNCNGQSVKHQNQDKISRIKEKAEYVHSIINPGSEKVRVVGHTEM